MALDHTQIAFIGGGHITEIIIDNLTGTELISPEQLIVSDPTRARLEALHDRYSVVTTTNNQDATSKGDYIFINVHPTVVDDVIEDLRQAWLAGEMKIGAAAGSSHGSGKRTCNPWSGCARRRAMWAAYASRLRVFSLIW